MILPRAIVLATVGLLAAGCSGGGEADTPTTPAPTTPALTTTVTSTVTSTVSPAGPVDPCAGIVADGDGQPPDVPATAEDLRSCLRLNHIQTVGTHNSYKLPVPEPIFPVLASFDAALAAELEYWHPPLVDQFSDQDVRQIELDVFADPEGGLFAKRVGLEVVGAPNNAPPELFDPGFKVLHVQDLDYATSCLTLVECLTQLRAWSDANPGHVPIAVLVELKEAAIPDPINAGFVVPVPFDVDLLDGIDADIRSVFDDERILLPDHVRGDAPTLEQAVLTRGWPTLADAAGRVLFLMDNGGGLRDLYREGRPSLEGRVMFTNAVPGEPDAAFVKVNDPLAEPGRIERLVSAGYVVRTRADSPTIQARSGDTTQRDAAFASGAHWVSTDYPVPGSSPFSDYHAALPGGGVARCNPVTTGPRCSTEGIEPIVS